MELVPEKNWHQILRSISAALLRCEAAFVVTLTAIASVGVFRLSDSSITTHGLLLIGMTQAFLVGAMAVRLIFKRRNHGSNSKKHQDRCKC